MSRKYKNSILPGVFYIYWSYSRHLRTVDTSREWHSWTRSQGLKSFQTMDWLSGEDTIFSKNDNKYILKWQLMSCSLSMLLTGLESWVKYLKEVGANPGYGVLESIDALLLLPLLLLLLLLLLPLELLIFFDLVLLFILFNRYNLLPLNYNALNSPP